MSFQNQRGHQQRDFQRRDYQQRDYQQRDYQRETDEGKFFVGNLNWETDSDSLASFFGKYGPVKDAVVIMDRATGRSRGFGFVTFQNPDDKNKVLNPANDGQLEIDNRRVNARECKN